MRLSILAHMVLSAVTVLMLFASAAAQAPQLPEESDFLVQLRPPGINSKTAAKGDEIRATVITPAEFAGYEMVGSVGDIKSSGKVRGKTSMSFSFDHLEKGSIFIPLSANLKQVTNSKGAPDVDEEGHAIKKKGHTGKLLASSVAGGVIGGLLGGAKGAALGAGIGAAGALIAIELSVDSGADFSLAPDSRLLVEVKPDRRRPNRTTVAAYVGTYVNQQSSADFLELKADNQFALRQRGKDYTGTYEVSGDVFTISVNGGPTSRGQISTDRIFDPDGTIWVKQVALIAAPEMHNGDVLRLVEANVPDEVIISKVRASTAKFDTGTDAIVQLKKAGVSDAVLKAMIEVSARGN